MNYFLKNKIDLIRTYDFESVYNVVCQYLIENILTRNFMEIFQEI